MSKSITADLVRCPKCQKYYSRHEVHDCELDERDYDQDEAPKPDPLPDWITE